jgi:transposase
MSRYELTDFEWRVIDPLLPNKPRGVPRVDDRRVLNGIFWILRSGSPWRDLPGRYGPHTTCYNQFRRWTKAGVWNRIMVTEQGGWANIPPKTNRKSPICFSPWLYKQRNLVERFFNKLKYYRRIATRYDKLGSAYLAMVKLACIRIRLRHYESTA